MLPLLVGLTLAVLPAIGRAGFGTTFALGRETGGGSKKNDAIFAELLRYPTVDVHGSGLILQLHMLNLIVGVLEGDTRFGSNLFFFQRRRAVGQGWIGAFGPGVSLDFVGDLDLDPLTMMALGLFRVGVMQEGDMAFGLFIVPGAGISLTRGRLRAALSGTLQVCVWLPTSGPPATETPAPTPLPSPLPEEDATDEPKTEQPATQGSDAPAPAAVEGSAEAPPTKPALEEPDAGASPPQRSPPEEPPTEETVSAPGAADEPAAEQGPTASPSPDAPAAEEAPTAPVSSEEPADEAPPEPPVSDFSGGETQ